MEQSYLSKIMAVLKIAYPYYFKEMEEEDSRAFLSLYSKKLKDFEYQVAAKAIDEIITKSKFMPTLSEVLEECNRQKRIYYKTVIDEMYKSKYFATDQEYGKALTWLFEEKPIIPSWLQQDIIKFKNQKQIEMKEEK